MRYFRIVMLMLLAVLVPSGGAAGPGRLSLICDEWPPYQIVKNNQISGFSAAVVSTVLQRMGVAEIELSVYPWKRAVMMMKRGAADGLFSANYTKPRTAFARYPDEAIVQAPWVIWTREEDGLTFDSWKDLAGLSVGLVRGYSYTPEFWQFVRDQACYEEVVDDEQNFKKLSAGRVDVIVAELGNGRYLLKRLGLKGIVPLTRHPVKVDGLYLIFSRTKVPDSFVQRFSRELARFKQTPLYRQLYDTHF